MAGGDAPELAPPPGARVFRLDVPGFGARDLRVTVERPKRVVEIAFSKTFTKNAGSAATSSRTNAVVSARCADGALPLVVAPPAPPAPVAVPVSAEAPALPAPGPDAAALGEDEITVLRRAVPGRKAAHFEVVATAGAAKDGATLRVSAGADAGGTRGRVASRRRSPASRLALAEGVRRGRRPDRHRGRASARGDQDRRGARGRARGAPGERVPSPRAEAAADARGGEGERA